jgi:hypothetical protein
VVRQFMSPLNEQTALVLLFSAILRDPQKVAKVARSATMRNPTLADPPPSRPSPDCKSGRPRLSHRDLDPALTLYSRLGRSDCSLLAHRFQGVPDAS